MSQLLPASLLPLPLLLGYAFALGACLGSFVGLVVARLPHQQSVVWPRSYCDHCEQTLRWFDVVPVLSFVWLRGRSRCCRRPLGVRLVWLELVLGDLGCALLLQLGVCWLALAWLPLLAALLAIALLDIDHWWVPDSLSGPAFVYALAISLLPGGVSFRAAVLGLLPAAALWLFAVGYVRLTGREGMGLGDVKILAIVGAALGARGALAVLILACLQGAFIGVAVLLRGGHLGSLPAGAPPPKALADDDWQPPASAVPFGPFLTLATVQVLLLPGLMAWPWRLALMCLPPL